MTQSSSTTELELTDGWYSVKSFVDSAMASLLQRKKIVVGTKLMIQGAELLNCEQGCDPLEVIFLKNLVQIMGSQWLPLCFNEILVV